MVSMVLAFLFVLGLFLLADRLSRSAPPFLRRLIVFAIMLGATLWFAPFTPRWDVPVGFWNACSVVTMSAALLAMLSLLATPLPVRSVRLANCVVGLVGTVGWLLIAPDPLIDLPLSLVGILILWIEIWAFDRLLLRPAA